VDALTGAKKSVLVQAYSFTSAPIAKALVDAHRRGVEVKVILDRSNRTAHYSAATFLAHAGIPVWIDAQHAIAHDKVMIIDGNTQNLTGGLFSLPHTGHRSENLAPHSPQKVLPNEFSVPHFRRAHRLSSRRSDCHSFITLYRWRPPCRARCVSAAELRYPRHCAGGLWQTGVCHLTRSHQTWQCAAWQPGTQVDCPRFTRQR
jgi:hypothetical protein